MADGPSHENSGEINFLRKKLKRVVYRDKFGGFQLVQ